MKEARALRYADAAKKPTNVSLNADLVRRAKSHGINISHIAEAALEEAVRQKAREQWLADNADAIERYNADVDSRGTFSDGLRRF